MVPPVSVPNVPGVPNVIFAAASAALPILMTADTFGFFDAGGPIWGLFQSGAPVIYADTVLAFDYRQDWSLCDYPLERGGFESYNKVQLPFDVRIRFVQGGSEADRANLLASCHAIAGTLQLFDAVTPEAIYVNVNVKHMDYHRSSQNGVGLLIVDLWLEEIRLTSQASAFSSIMGMSGAAQINGGTVQSVPATGTQAETIAT